MAIGPQAFTASPIEGDKIPAATRIVVDGARGGGGIHSHFGGPSRFVSAPSLWPS
jgi:hypothetical protein